MMKKTIFAIAAMAATMAALTAHADIWTDPATGYTWTYKISNGGVVISTGYNSYQAAISPLPNGHVRVPVMIGGKPVTSIGACAFFGCHGLTGVTIPESVTSIGESAFQACTNLVCVTMPENVISIANYAFYGCRNLKCVTIKNGSVIMDGTYTFHGCSPEKLLLLGHKPVQRGCFTSLVESSESVKWTRQYGVEYMGQPFLFNKFGGYADQDSQTTVGIVSASIRENDPTVMDIIYKVESDKPTVKIRALAFEDGQRSFTNVVRPETFVDGTDPANWDAVEANVEHTLSWKVSSDWATRLAKVKFEILVCEGDLLPLELRMIPASDQYGKMKISWNAITKAQVFDALLWLYADKDPGLTLANGVLKNGTTQLASGASTSNPNAIRYIYSKMGYQLLTGAPLSYANSETRLGLSPYGARQYAYKIVEE